LTSQAMGPRHFRFQFFEGAVVDAFAGIGDSLEALQGVGAGGEDVAGSALQDDFVAPELGLDAAHATEAPFVRNERIDEEALLGVSGAVLFVRFGGELGEIFGLFIEHDLVDGVDAVFQSVEAGLGLACGGAGTGGFLRVGAAGRWLFES